MQIEAGAKLSHDQLIVNAKDIGQDITPYYLRHTYATMLCENNVPIKAAQYFMGHTDSKMLMDIYADNSDIMQEQGKQILTQMQLQKPQTRQKVDTENDNSR
ncbi:MAG: tyrosine-type recombinase/integrase [Thermacetogeniaceae bacterium]|jgi:integrase